MTNQPEIDRLQAVISELEREVARLQGRLNHAMLHHSSDHPECKHNLDHHE